MKLLYFTIQFNMAGGLARIVTDKVNWLVEHGYDVTICNIEPLEVKPYYSLDARVKLIRGDIQTTPGGILTRAKGVWRAARRMGRVIEEVQPDVIVNAHCPLVTWLLPWVNDTLRYDTAGGLRYGQKAYDNVEKEDGRKKIPVVMEIHQSLQGLEVFDRQYMRPWTRWMHLKAIKWIYGRYDRFVVLTSGDYEAWGRPRNGVVIPNFASLEPQVCIGTAEERRNLYGSSKTSLHGSPADDVLTTENAESTEKEDRRWTMDDGRWMMDDGGKQIIMLARLMPQKRIDLMMRVWALVAKDFPEWHVKVLGEGLERENLEKLRAELGIEKTFLMPGEVKDVREELACSDLFCLTSEYEGFGIVVLEAQQLGVPVVAFRYVGVDDLIEDGQDGYVVSFGDVEAYANRLRRLMENEEDRRRLIANGKVSVRKFDKERVMEKWERLFAELTR